MKKLSIPFMFFALLACVSLACEAVNVINNPGPLRVESVDVAPAEGSGAFTASVALTAHTEEDTLSCYIPPSKSVYNQSIPPSNTSSILTFVFIMTEPGNYQLYCTAMKLGISGKAAFTVTGADAAESGTPTPGGETVQPIRVNGAGQKTDYSGGYSCSAAATLLLMVNADGSAVLEATGPGFIDHINCTQSASLEGWFIAGSANPGTETVTFTSCNSGGFTAQGSVSYAGGVLSGEVTCIGISGSDSGKPVMKLNVP